MRRKRRDLDFMRANAEAALGLDEPSMVHLTSQMSIRNYIRIAGEIGRREPGSRILDWGAGYGQMSFLLERRGLHAVAYDIGGAFHDRRLPVTQGVHAVVGRHPVDLPFRAGSFDAVLSCGVLEHVPDEEGSLDEIGRVLAHGGRLYLYNLPQKYSYKEVLIRLLRLGYTHERTYAARSLRALLERHGFEILRVRRGGMLPHNLTGLPIRVRDAYGRAVHVLFVVDRLVSRIPLLNRLAESLEVVAVSGAQLPDTRARGLVPI